MASVEDARHYSHDVLSTLDLCNDEGWQEQVRNVVVILSASRSGSSLLFNALSTSPNIISPAGEHEPWLLLSENKYPFTESDQIDEVANKELLLGLLRNDLLVRTTEVDSQEYLALVANRMKIRGLRMPPDAEGEIASGDSVDVVVHQHLQKGGYGLKKTLAAPLNTQELLDKEHVYPVENPPYIEIPLARRASIDEIAIKTLLFKSPSDAYRPGMYEQLFPNANIRYIHLTRGYAQTINGIMDGWLSEDEPFISNGVGLFDAGIDIGGYTRDEQSAKYWCFDLFPGWRSYDHSDLLSIGALQWIQAHRHILEGYRPHQKIAFEGLYRDQTLFTRTLEEMVGCKIDPSIWDVPVMATHAPRQARWKGRETIFRNIHEHLDDEIHTKLKDVNEELGYSEEPETWL